MSRSIRKIDIFVDNVVESATLLRDVFEFSPVYIDDNFAELSVGDASVLISRDARIPVKRTQGLVIHVEVADAAIAAREATERGGEVLLPTETTTWGTESTLFRGPGGTVIDLYRDAPGP